MARSEERKHAILSASSAHRWLRCPMSATAEAGVDDRGTDYAAEGTLAHAVAESFASGSEAIVPEGATQEMIDCARAYSDFITEHCTEASTVMLERTVDFSEWVPEGFGTADCLIVDDGHLTVIDYKYGVGVPVEAEENDQMRLYALGAIHDLSALFDIDSVTMCIYQPRIDNISGWDQSTKELLEWADGTLRPAAEKAASGKGGYQAGAWCKFCKHAGKCRRLASACTEIVELFGEKRKVEQLAPWEINDALRSFPMIELWMRRLQEEALRKLMAGEEIPGQKLVEGRSVRKWDDPGSVIGELAAVLPEHDYLTAPELMSPAQLEKSIGKSKVAELVGPYITRAPGKVGIAPIEDKRPAYEPGGEFEKLN